MRLTYEQHEGATVGAELVNVRGWLEGETADIELVRESIEEDAITNWYNFCWNFPRQQGTGHWYAFFGAHIGTEDVHWFIARLRQLAVLGSTLGEPRIRGQFVISGVDTAMTRVQVENGTVDVIRE